MTETVFQRFQDWLNTAGWPEWASYVVPWLVGVVVMLAFILLMVMVLIYIERRVLGRFQVRPGPNRVGPHGILQPVADAIKVLLKEDIVPATADKWVHWLAPIIVFIPVIMIFAVIPVYPETTLANLNIGILYIIAISTLSALGVFMAAWSSNNKYTLIAGMRAIAQVVSYEIPLVLSIIGVLIMTGSLSMLDIVEAQTVVPFLLLQPLGFLIYFIGASAELNRSPFDLLEAESELVTGYHIEYSGMKFALFYLAEYGHALVASAIIATLFLGGWKGPWSEYLGPIWFLLKLLVVFFLMLWTRSTLPRLRVDQLMGFAWKFLLPLAVFNLILVGVEAIIWPDFPWYLLFLNFVAAGVLIVLWSKLFKFGRGERVEV